MLMQIPSIDKIKKILPDISELQEIKVGGQKAVYKTTSKQWGDVVVKYVLPDGNFARIKREIDIAKSNTFPHVPTIFDCNHVSSGDATGLYIVEQYVKGEDLRTILDNNRKLSFSQAMLLLQELLETVKKLEECNVVHRDIKPDNVIRDHSGHFWLIDFGIARDLNQVSLTATDANLGPHTAGYAAPEQFRNMKKKIDSRADLFSIGVLAYEMLTGKHPFVDGARGMIDILLRTETITEVPLTFTEDVHGEVSQFIQTLMRQLRSLDLLIE